MRLSGSESTICDVETKEVVHHSKSETADPEASEAADEEEASSVIANHTHVYQK